MKNMFNMRKLKKMRHSMISPRPKPMDDCSEYAEELISDDDISTHVQKSESDKPKQITINLTLNLSLKEGDDEKILNILQSYI